jgi:hypothetical protein
MNSITRIILLGGLLIICSSLILQSAEAGEPPEARWEKIFSSVYGHESAPVQQTNDEGYIVAGADSGRGGIWGDLVIKTDSNGEEEWAKSFDGTFHSVQQTRDGGYILLGWYLSRENISNIPDTHYAIKLIKMDPSGEKEWEKLFPKPHHIIFGNYVQQTNDNGYIMVGEIVEHGKGELAIPDIWLIKADKNGNEEWNKTFGGKGNDTAYCVQQNSDGGYIIVGWTDSHLETKPPSYGIGPRDVWLIKTDENGNEEWNKTFGSDDSDDAGYFVQQTSDGGYVITGYYGVDVWLLKTDASGNMEWNKTFGGGVWDVGYSVQQTDDGGYIIVGSTESYARPGRGRCTDVWLIKTDLYGNEKWSKTFSGKDNRDNCGYSVHQTSDGGYIIGGRTHPDLTPSNILLIKVGGKSENKRPVANAGSIYLGNTEEKITFDASRSYDPDGTIKYYCWDFDDDGRWDTAWLSSPTVEHKYWSNGSYKVRLEVKDDEGGTDTVTASVIIGKNRGDAGSNGIPGFEVIFLIIAIVVSLMRKRKIFKN